MRRNPPNWNQLKAYDVNRVNALEGTYQPLYDYGTAGNYLAAGQLSLDFFQVPIGQGGKSEADTNMQTGGSLGTPQNFLIEAVEVCFWPSSTLVARAGLAAAALDADFLRDVYAVANAGAYLELSIGSKVYLRDGPLSVFPPTFGLAGWGSTNQTTTADMNGSEQSYARFGGQQYEVVGLRLISNQPFRVSLKWPALVPLPSGVAGRIGVRLPGYLYRLSQ